MAPRSRSSPGRRSCSHGCGAPPSWLPAPAGLFAASLAAEIALFPVGALVFSRVTAAGLVVNFAAIPLMTAVQAGGMVLLAAAELLPGAVPCRGLSGASGRVGAGRKRAVRRPGALGGRPAAGARTGCAGCLLRGVGGVVRGQERVADAGCGPGRGRVCAQGGDRSACRLRPVDRLHAAPARRPDGVARSDVHRRRAGGGHAGAVPVGPGVLVDAGGAGAAASTSGGGWSSRPCGPRACFGPLTSSRRTAMRTTWAARRRSSATCAARGLGGRAGASRTVAAAVDGRRGRGGRGTADGAARRPHSLRRGGGDGLAPRRRTGNGSGCATTTRSCSSCATATCRLCCPATSRRRPKRQSRGLSRLPACACCRRRTTAARRRARGRSCGGGAAAGGGQRRARQPVRAPARGGAGALSRHRRRVLRTDLDGAITVRTDGRTWK